MYDVIIIGAGASGLLTACLVAENGLRTAVLERNNEPARKLYATGNGHCNYLNTNAEGFKESKRVLESIGIVGTEDEDGRFYPMSREASSVVKALIFAAKKRGADITCDCHVSDIKRTESGFAAVSKDGRKFECRKLVIASGGKAGIQFGCYGEGYRWAQYMGHSLIKPVPALAAIEPLDDISELAGVRVRARAKIFRKEEEGALPCEGAFSKELIALDEGEVQFTKDSISGICVMNLSRYVRLEDGISYALSLDMFPEYSTEELAALFQRQKEACGFETQGLMPEKLQGFLFAKTGKEKVDHKALAELSKDLRFSVKGTKGWADAQVTSGGVPLSELDPETMESLKVPGLYFTGEITDYDGPCGGYNLANAWRTAIAAGNGIINA